MLELCSFSGEADIRVPPYRRADISIYDLLDRSPSRSSATGSLAVQGGRAASQSGRGPRYTPTRARIGRSIPGQRPAGTAAGHGRA